MERLSDTEIKKLYQKIKIHFDRYLKDKRVILPNLKIKEKYTKSALVLVYLAQGYPSTKKVSKHELTEFVRHYYPETNDVQDARHLGMQKGWYIASGTRKNGIGELGYGEYQLISLEKPHPSFITHRKGILDEEGWNRIKKEYGNKCASCGSEEGKPNIHYPGTVTKLTKGHMDPNKELTVENIIPQCEKCNRPDRNYWVYDKRGRVIKVANAKLLKNLINRSNGKFINSFTWNLEVKIPMNDYLNKIIHGDALDILPKLPASSIDLILTDPPYFLDKMDNSWDDTKVSSNKYHHAVKSLPAGMKFDRQQGINFYRWFYQVSCEFLRILKPGGFLFSFSSPRLYHRMACAVDDAGLLLKDCFIWLYTQNQVKAMSINHFIDRMKVDDKIKEDLRQQFSGWKTPQIKSCYEPILMAQKQPDGTFLRNMQIHKVGLFNTDVKIGNNMFPSNVLSVENIHEVIDKYFLVAKPSKNEKRSYNDHRTVKPLAICEYIIKLATFSNDAVVLDPFIGSGTTALAAKKLGRNYIGVDINEKYVKIALKRLGIVEEKLKKIDGIKFNGSLPQILDL